MMDVVFSGLVSSIATIFKTTVLVVGLFEESSSPNCDGLPKEYEQQIVKTVASVPSFRKKFGSFLPIITADTKILVVGLGKKEELDENKALALGGKIYAELERLQFPEASLAVGSGENINTMLAYGMLLRSFKFDKYVTKKKEETKLEKVHVFLPEKMVKTAESIFSELKIEADSIFMVRNLVTEPANVLHPSAYADIVKTELPKFGVEVEVFDEEYMQQKNMGALLGVGQGSSFTSRLVVMRWNGGPADQKPIAFVGKGVTFDTGGISVKPAKGMWDMKYDMAGSAAVVGVIRTLAARGAKVNAVGVIGIVENAIDGDAQRPGDIVTSMSGQTIEVLNTDAEGRLVLADALWYTQDRFAPELMIDLATLTGAIVVALGNNQYAGLFSNNDDLSEKLTAAGIEADEKLWRFPLSEKYDRLIDSSIADVQNIATSSGAPGSIEAAQFLQRFVNDVKWAHLDIAGTAWAYEDLDTSPRGATAFGVRLLNRFVHKYYEGAK